MLIKLIKAIEIMKERARLPDPLKDPDYELAHKLAITGLEAIRFARTSGSWYPTALLPGEQPEEITKGG